MKTIRAMALAATLTAMSCGSSAGTGTVTVSIWGEEYIQDMIPPLMGMEAGIENGWTVRYTKFLVNVGGIRMATTSGTVGGSIPGFRVFDLHPLTGPLTIGSFASVEALRYDNVSYAIAPADNATTMGNATAADVTLMKTGRFAMYVEGTASKMGMPDTTFRWGFTNRTNFTSCHDSAEQAGVAVPTSGTATAQITIHGDHLFYDDLQNPEARMRFDAIAAAERDGDRVVTLDELGMVQLTTLPMMQYGVGPTPGINNLRDFVTHISATVGHFNGEGHCQEQRLAQ